jgi:hypothetical protein
MKSKKQICLIERSKFREDKSIGRNNQHIHGEKIQSPKSGLRKTGLKRIKSSTALLSTLKRSKI